MRSVFSNHLDVGFDGIDPILGYARNVVNIYFVEVGPNSLWRVPTLVSCSSFSLSLSLLSQYIPRAIHTAEQMRKLGADRYIWMTQSWIISLYLDCPPHMGLQCPSADDQAALRKAIAAGDITYHAYPFNAELEFMEPSLLSFGFEMTHALDDALGVPRKTVMSQRDVPGSTRAAVPLLVANGVHAISFGVTGFSAPPAMPRAFVWSDPASKTSVIGMYHAGGYGGIDAADAVVVPALSSALIMDW